MKEKITEEQLVKICTNILRDRRAITKDDMFNIHISRNFWTKGKVTRAEFDKAVEKLIGTVAVVPCLEQYLVYCPQSRFKTMREEHLRTIDEIFNWLVRE